ncbi:hypothetical protein SARC_00848 [Sphaeroforma arctica JP610]|uniref:RGS domain-containing protein n=1 Tax=Sphaeroforma arctica JP610 TaxID=667725 RepID=A0A0L0GFI2_9EUKA|nr:hypothetical protein SARC_00848 [Sphaeroforma arctica JP610]KNC87038.1 hypothetical protein SARC_00848 [Sphaeroforma arctica JP610]|eukprot:XP_014160940.1 hypothetical protein SARC_00848 [Sphaeroforma arctica JP610]
MSGIDRENTKVVSTMSLTSKVDCNGKIDLPTDGSAVFSSIQVYKQEVNSITDNVCNSSSGGSANAVSQRDLELAYAEKSEALRQRATRYSFLLALLVYPLAFGIAALFFWVSYGTEKNVNILVVTGGSKQFDYILICHIPTIIFILCLFAFVLVYWNEPEIRSRDHDFFLHLLGIGLLQEVVTVLTAALSLQMMPLKAIDFSTGTVNSDWETAIFWSFLCLSFCFNMILIPNLARMSNIKYLFCEQRISVPYWVLPIAYVVVWFCTHFVSLMYCEYNGNHICSEFEFYSGVIALLAIHNIHYYYCAWKGREARHCFIDYISNLRAYTIVSLSAWAIIVYVITQEDRAANWYLYFYQPWFMLVTLSMESFAMIVVRVLSRKWSSGNALVDIDMVGEHYREAENRNKGVKELLENKNTRRIVQDVARRLRCEEHVDFLIAVYACNKTAPLSISMVFSIAAQFIEVSSPLQINIDQSCRQKILDLINNEGTYYATTEPLFRDAVAHVTKLIVDNCMPEVYTSLEYKKWAIIEKRNMLDRF